MLIMSLAKIIAISLLLLGFRSLLVLGSKEVEREDDVEDAVVEDMPDLPGNRMPTAEELLAALDSMSGMPADEKETLRREIMRNMNGMNGDAAPEPLDEDGVAHVTSSVFASQFFILMAMLTLVTLIFVFFGYKLYKSLSERERKREEKKKNKQMKKKK